MFFSVVIPTYNRAQILKETLESLFNQSVDILDYEVIVVNDGSTDKTDQVAAAFKKKYKNFKYLKQRNQGQGVARNTGLKEAKGKVVVLIGDDIIPTQDFLFEHQKFHYMHEEENAAVLGFTAWHPKLKVNNFMKWLVNGSSILGKFGGHQFAYEKLRGKELADYNFFYTSNISIKKSLLEKYPFDPAFSGYGWEDIELGYRLEQEAGLKLYYNSWAVGYHDHYMEESSLASRMEAIGRSAWLIHRKYPHLQKVPGLPKRILLSLIASFPVIIFSKILKTVSGEKLDAFYYYALSKKYFLRGVREGEKLYSF